MKKFMLAAILVAVICSCAYALDVNPPLWRGQSGTTLESWEFNTDNITPLPDFVYNPFGSPSVFVYPTHPWFAQWGGKEGVWAISGAIIIDIPNNLIDRESKLLQIQLTWTSQYPDAALISPGIGIAAKRVGGQAVPLEDIVLLSQTKLTLGLTNEQGAGTYWYNTTYVYEITPNPMFETIWISGSVAVDEVIIDTICIPGPVTLVVLSPNGGEVLTGDSTNTITWSSTGSISNVLIEYSTDDGSNWTSIDTVPNTGSYNWIVPNINSNQCLVRVSDANNSSISDISNAVFTIRQLTLNDGLVAYWSFDNDSGSIATDSSGQNNDGTIIGATLTEDRFGNSNKAYFLDGGDYIDVPDAPSLNPTDAITITVWFKGDSFGRGTYSWPPIVKKSDNYAQTNGYAFEMGEVYENRPSLSSYVYLEGQGWLGTLEPHPPVVEGTWYFAALVYDGSTLTTFLRSIDQTSFITASNTGSGNIVAASNNLNIGRDPANPDRFFNGAIDDVRIYNRALTAVEIQNLYTTSEPIDIVWVSINDPGFVGQMSKYETTNAQYAQFLNSALASGDIVVSGNDAIGANGSNSGTDYVGQLYYDGDGPGFNFNGATNGVAARINYTGSLFAVDSGFENHPVTYVSWYGAMAFCNYYGYRLPTEEEWWAVADFDGSYTYGCGTTINNSMANYYNSTHPDGTTAVGAFGTYGYGLADMTGNVWEWTSSGSGNSRLAIGGCWGIYDYECIYSYSHNHYHEQNYTDDPTGFRVCRDSTPNLVTVPYVVGMTQVQAGAAITSANLTVGTIIYAFSATVPAGNIISQEPVAGAESPTGSVVNLVISLGTISTATSIQTLIDEAVALRTGEEPIIVTIPAGTYTGDIIVDKPNVTLKSAAGAAATIIQLVNGVGITIYEDADSFVLDGFTIQPHDTDTTRAIELAGGSTDVNIANNIIDVNSNAAYLAISVGVAGTDGLTVINNSIAIGSGDGGIWGPDVSNVLVQGNTISGPAAHITSGYAVEFAGITGDSFITGNTLTNCGSGIFIISACAGGGTTVAEDVTISNNTVSQCQRGIRLGHSSDTEDMNGISVIDNVIQNNVIGLYIPLADDADLIDAASFIVTGNTFAGNISYGVQNLDTEELPAELNWWNAASGPYNATTNPDGLGDVVSDNVDFDPYLTLIPSVAVPDVVGMTQTNAESEIVSACLIVGAIDLQYSNTVPAGNVISQYPNAGTEVAIGSAVNLVASLGIEAVVPNVVGMTQADANSAITGAGLVVGNIYPVYSDTVPAGEVMCQSPNAGTQFPIGSAVDIAISWYPKTFYVDNNAPSDPEPNNPNISDPDEDGSLSHPFDAIQKAIDAAMGGDTIIVLDGIYTGTGNRDIEFHGKGITITGTDPNDPNMVERTIIDCNGTETENHRVFYIVGISSPTKIIIRGLTIRGGDANEGGAIYSKDCATIISNCLLEGNKAIYGGAVYFQGGTSTYVTQEVVILRDGSLGYGEPIERIATPQIIGCRIIGNSATYGGGIYCTDSVLLNNVIANNSADYGGGIYSSMGGSIFNDTISDNSAIYGGGIYAADDSNTTITNSIVWGNAATDGNEIALTDSSIIDVNYSDIKGGEAGVYSEPNCIINWGNGNIDTDPLLRNHYYIESVWVIGRDGRGYWDECLHIVIDGLLPDSPCIDAGDPNYVPQPNETDLDGNPRVVGGRIDMGAYEYQKVRLPDLEVTSEDINFVPLPGVLDGTATISATIWNIGQVKAENVKVVFYDFNEFIGEVDIPNIQPGDSNTVSIQHTWTEASFRLITVTVDPQGRGSGGGRNIDETDETNNTASKLYQVGNVSKMDAHIEITSSVPPSFTVGSTASICGNANYKILMTGLPDFVYPVKGGLVSAKIKDSNGNIVQTLSNRYTNTAGQFNISFAVPGEAEGRFSLDITITDGTLTGSQSRTFDVTPVPQQQPIRDFWVGDMAFDNESPNVNDIVNVEATVYAHPDNNSTEYNIPVTFYAYNQSLGEERQVIGSTQNIAQLQGGESNSVSIQWIPSEEGVYLITAELGSGFSDDNYWNNSTSSSVVVGMFTVSASPYWAKAGDVVQITIDSKQPLSNDSLDTVIVKDSSGNDILPDVNVVYIPGSTRWIYQTTALTEITATGRASIVVTGTDINGTHTGYGDFYIYSQSQPMPDLYLNTCDVSVSKINPALGETISIGATVHNDNTVDVNVHNVPVTFYANHPAGDYKIGSTQVIPEIAAGEEETVSIAWENVAEGIYAIEVRLEPGFSDRNYWNNSATRAVVVGEPNLPFEAEFAVINKNRVGRTMFDYNCQVSLKNLSDFTVRVIQVELESAPANMSIADASVNDFENIGAGETQTSADTCTFRVDRSEPINVAQVTWKVTYEIINACPSLQQMSHSMVDLEPQVTNAADITGDGRVDCKDLEKIADQWLLPPGNPSADIAPQPNGDGIINFLDFAVLAENWMKE